MTVSLKLGSIPHHPNEKYRITLPDGVPRPPILGMYVAKRGQGKSTAAVRLIKYYIDHQPSVFHSDLTFVISPTAESQSHLWKYLGIPEENIFGATTSNDVKTVIDSIISLLRALKEKHDHDEEYLEAYRLFKAKKELSPRQQALLDQRDCQPLVDPEPWPRPVLLLDDLSHLKVLDQKWFISLCLRHRHLAGGVSLSMLIILQSLRGGLSRVVRQNCSLICLFSTHDKDCKDDLYRECSHLLDKAEFEAVFADATDEFHSFLAVDLSQTEPNKVFSKNLEHWYEIRLGSASQPENTPDPNPKKKKRRESSKSNKKEGDSNMHSYSHLPPKGAVPAALVEQKV